MVSNPKDTRCGAGRVKAANRLDGEVYIEVLRSCPGKPIPAAALYGWDQSCPFKYIDDNPNEIYIPELGVYLNEPELPIEMTDQKTIDEVAREVKILQTYLHEAVENNDIGRKEDLLDRIEKHEKYLREVATPWGTPREFPGYKSKALKRIRQAVDYYVTKLALNDPGEAAYIRDHLVIDHFCYWSDS